MEQRLKLFRLVLVTLVLMIGQSLCAQTSITGTVTDPNGEPIIGATVMEKGTKNATVTDLDGNFTLQAPTGAIIQFSYVGFETQERPARPSMKIVLKEDQESLDEVVVVGYGV